MYSVMNVHTRINPPEKNVLIIPIECSILCVNDLRVLWFRIIDTSESFLLFFRYEFINLYTYRFLGR